MQSISRHRNSLCNDISHVNGTTVKMTTKEESSTQHRHGMKLNSSSVYCTKIISCCPCRTCANHKYHNELLTYVHRTLFTCGYGINSFPGRWHHRYLPLEPRCHTHTHAHHRMICLTKGWKSPGTLTKTRGTSIQNLGTGYKPARQL